jgi:hypothetical protein
VLCGTLGVVVWWTGVDGMYTLRVAVCVSVAERLVLTVRLGHAREGMRTRTSIDTTAGGIVY